MEARSAAFGFGFIPLAATKIAPRTLRVLVTLFAPSGGMNPNPNAASLTKFDALEVALELIRELRPVIAKIRRHSRNDADELERAAHSIARNLGEGSRRLGRDRIHHWSIAGGSAKEVGVTLRICLAAGWIDDPDLTRVWPLVDRECAMTWKMTH